MKKRPVFFRSLFAGAALFAASAAACGDYTASSVQVFDSSLRGTWETNSPPEYLPGYSGGIVITRGTIAVTGYEGFIGYGADETTRPFSGITRSAALPGWSEKTVLRDYPDHEGMLYIKDAGVWQPGIAYSFYRAGSGSASYQYFLRLSFGGREETLRKTAN